MRPSLYLTLGQATLVYSLSDVIRPGELDGIGLARLVHKRWPDLPVLLTSAMPQPDVPPHVCLLRKPYWEQQLLDAITTCLAEAEANRHAAAPVVPRMTGVPHAQSPTSEPDNEICGSTVAGAHLMLQAVPGLLSRSPQRHPHPNCNQLSHADAQ